MKGSPGCVEDAVTDRVMPPLRSPEFRCDGENDVRQLMFKDMRIENTCSSMMGNNNPLEGAMLPAPSIYFSCPILTEKSDEIVTKWS